MNLLKGRLKWFDIMQPYDNLCNQKGLLVIKYIKNMIWGHWQIKDGLEIFCSFIKL